jgi:hypothetical protein
MTSTGIASTIPMAITTRNCMKLLSMFDTRELEAFAVNLAEDLGRRFPPASESRTDPGAKHQIKVILEGLAARAVRYHEQNKLGVYRKAKLANSFRWKLSELGYSKPFVEKATKEIVTKIAAK